jgi:hypothetical protein
LCKSALLGIRREGKQLYSLAKVYEGMDIGHYYHEDNLRVDAKMNDYLYRLSSDFLPF